MKADNDKNIPDIDLKSEMTYTFMNVCMPSGFAAITTAPEAKLIFVNDNLVKMLGYASSGEMIEAVNKALWDYVHSDDLEYVKSVIKKSQDEFGDFELSYRMVRKDGSFIWGNHIAKRMIDKSGDMVVFVYCTDITKQKELEKQLILEKSKLEKITAQMNSENENLQKRYEEEIRYRKLINEQCLVTFKINLSQNSVEDCITTRESFDGLKKYKKITELFDSIVPSLACEQDLKNMRAVLDRDVLLEQYLKGERVFRTEYRRTTADGQALWLGVTVNLLEKPGSRDIIGFIYTQDINEEKELQLLVSEIIDVDYDFVAKIDFTTDGFILYNSTRGGGLKLGKSESYRKEVETYARAYVIEEDIERNIREMSAANVEKELQDSGKYVTYVDVRKTNGNMARKKLQFLYIDKASRRVMITRSDVTDLFNKDQQYRQLLEDTLAEAERANSAKSEFLSRISHEIRTPMNGIMGMTEIALEKTNDAEGVFECLKNIQISSKYLLTLLNDVLDMSRIEKGKIELVEEIIARKQFVHELNAIIKPQADNAKINYKFFTDDNCSDYYIGDSIRFKQILINLLNNAIKFTGEGGNVTVRSKQLKVENDVADLQFTIVDNGIGMSKKFLEHIFEPFLQEHVGNVGTQGGSGLGLAISQKLAELMGGGIRVQSEPGKGSIFTIDIKLKTVDNEYVERVNEQKGICMEDIDFADTRVLVVEDQPLNRMIVTLILEKKNCIVEGAENGQIGLDMFRESEEGYYSAVLMDVSMPIMDGLTATKMIRGLERSDAKTVPIIAMTANAFKEDVEKSIEAGMNEHLTKPVESQKLYDTLYFCIVKNKEEFRINDL